MIFHFFEKRINVGIFCTDEEIKRVRESQTLDCYSGLYWGLLNRVGKYTDDVGLNDEDANTSWWHHAAEYLLETSLVAKLQPKNEKACNWLKNTVMNIVNRSDDDWVGPTFRKRDPEYQRGHLETAHLIIGIAFAYDLCPELFTDGEVKQIRAKLAIAQQMCRNWLERIDHLSNWCAILLAGYTVAAAVLEDKDALGNAARDYEKFLDLFQEDGSYGESLQYANYCSYGLMYTYESLLRSGTISKDTLPGSYAKIIYWLVQSYFYNKPLFGWGAYPRPRSANFNDSAAITGGDPDLLLLISAKMKEAAPELAGLARWMFDELYSRNPSQGPFDRNSFGFINRYSYFSMLYYPIASASLSPEECKLDKTVYFSNGNCITRDRWNAPKTIIAFSGGSDKLRCKGHLHADLNSLMLVHEQERLFVDPGHSCYRTQQYAFDCATASHNTCTFKIANDTANIIAQKIPPARMFDKEGKPGDLVDRLSAQLMCERIDDVSVMAADAAKAYGEPLEKFERYCVLCGANAIFIIDHIKAAGKVTPTWHWVLNNRDNTLEHKKVYSDRIVARRGNVGMKIFHTGGDVSIDAPAYGCIHDAYHPLPNQPGEGKAGSAVIYNFRAVSEDDTFRRTHAIAVDNYGAVAGWHLVCNDNGDIILDDGKNIQWQLSMDNEVYNISELKSGRNYRLDAASHELIRLS